MGLLLSLKKQPKKYGQAGHAPPGLPTADGLVRYVEPLRQLRLAEGQLFSPLGNQRTGGLCVQIPSTPLATVCHGEGEMSPYDS